ncbi:hypothetical protein HG531_002478 [Fusarium graminearum]|nr:hypothetical protein HG531_002478 [Fusarium graminearum]
MDRQPPFLPELALGRRRSFDLARILNRMGRPEQTTLSNGDDKKQGQIQDLDGCNVNLVEPARAYNKFERDEQEHSKDVEGGLVCKHGVGLHAFEGEHSSSEADLLYSV